MDVTVIICTYRRANALGCLLDSLAVQTYRDFEVLVVDGSGEDPSVRREVAAWAQRSVLRDVRLIPAPTGLTRQRNIGLLEARGDILCFFDDDVTVGPTFLGEVRALLSLPNMRDVGGVTGYDILNYPAPVSWRWRLRRWLRTVPSLEPGAADRFGRRAPLSFAEPSPDCRRVRWLSGCCMIYRREAIEGLRFDEQLPTYGGEDGDFSTRVAERWRLLLCGSLLVRHHTSPVARVSDVRRVFETGFGAGRRFGKRVAGVTDYLVLVQYACSELLIDVLALILRPSAYHLRAPFARLRGLAVGVHSVLWERHAVARESPVLLSGDHATGGSSHHAHLGHEQGR